MLVTIQPLNLFRVALIHLSYLCSAPTFLSKSVKSHHLDSLTGHYQLLLQAGVAPLSNFLGPKITPPHVETYSMLEILKILGVTSGFEP